EFFGVETAKKLAADGKSADLLLGNNVLAHVPDINDFVAGMKVLLKDSGVITMEFPHLLRLVEQNQFDTIYHEHYSYLSANTVKTIFAAHGLRLFDVEELTTHGGSLRIYACHDGNQQRPQEARLTELLSREQAAGVDSLDYYDSFSEKVRRTKRELLKFLIARKEEGKTIVGYGAPAKGNTLLNYCGVRTDFLDYTVDISPYKQGLYLPGVHIPIYAPEKIRETKPDYVLILPWNLKDEVMEQMSYVRDWGGKFVTAIPDIQIS
ncbi:MAG: C-methyltransferase, partial [Proteobacteria bacterium]|nr:C-methyltransferase [Pseudomonadota bacterium]